MPFNRKVSPHIRTDPSPFHSTSNPHTMQARDYARMCTQVMEEVGEKPSPPSHCLHTCMAFIPLLCPWTMHYKQKRYLANPWDTADIVFAGFDLTFLIRDHGLNHLAGSGQAHTWGLSSFSWKWILCFTVKSHALYTAGAFQDCYDHFSLRTL